MTEDKSTKAQRKYNKQHEPCHCEESRPVGMTKQSPTNTQGDRHVVSLFTMTHNVEEICEGDAIEK